MNCACCGKPSANPECYFCIWWGSSLLAGAEPARMDRILRKGLKGLEDEKRKRDFVPTFGDRAGEAKAGSIDPSNRTRGFGLG
jgi:hypothetical protein